MSGWMAIAAIAASLVALVPGPAVRSAAARLDPERSAACVRRFLDRAGAPLVRYEARRRLWAQNERVALTVAPARRHRPRRRGRWPIARAAA